MSHKIILYLSLLLIISNGCQNNSKITYQLNLAEELMDTKPASAYEVLKKVNPRELSKKKEKALYALLYTQAQYKNYEIIRNDSLINIAVEYYTSKKNKYLASTFHYKAAVLSEIGDYKSAIEWYKRAEQATDSTNYLSLGLINTQIGKLYQKNFVANEEHIARYKKALSYYRQINHKKYENYTLNNIGQLYILRNKDSASYYLNNSVALSKLTKDSALLFSTLDLLSKLYLLQENYRQAKKVCLYIILNHNTIPISNSIFYNISHAYSKIGQIDSAEYYIKRIKNINLASDSVAYYIALSEISKAKNNYFDAYNYLDISNEISNKIILASRKRDLFAIEKQYDSNIANQYVQKLKSKMIIRNYQISIALLCFIVIISIFIIKWKRRERLHIQHSLIIEQLQNELQSYQNNIVIFSNNASTEIALSNQPLIKQHEIEQSVKEIIEDRMILLRKILNIKYLHESKPQVFIKKLNDIISINKKNNEDIKKIIMIANLNNKIIDKIMQIQPDLNSSDILLLSLVSLNFTSTEMRVFLNSPSTDAIYSHKYRLAKKLQVSSLTDFLSKIQ